MSEIDAFDAFDPSSTPAVEVLVYRGDHLVTTEWCDSEDEAEEVVARWTEQADLRCTVRDVSGADEGPADDRTDDHLPSREQDPGTTGSSL
jgi:hypothetical protein